MQYYGSHAASKAAPVDSWRVTLSGTQPKLEALFAKRNAALRKAGAFENRAERLKDRRPVPMIPSSTNWTPPPTARVKSDARPAYDHPGLTATQRANRTSYTLGKEVS